MLGSIPSNLLSYFDFNRFAELLVDGEEVIPATTAELDANVRAIDIVAAAETDIVEACRAKQNYTLQQLKDLVRDYQIGGRMGQQIISLIATLAFGHAMLRKRYAKGTPQAEDPSTPIGDARLEKLQKGTRIFALDGVEKTDGSGNVIGTYDGDTKPIAGLMSSAGMRTDLNAARGVWGSIRPRTDFGDY